MIKIKKKITLSILIESLANKNYFFFEIASPNKMCDAFSKKKQGLKLFLRKKFLKLNNFSFQFTVFSETSTFLNRFLSARGCFYVFLRPYVFIKNFQKMVSFFNFFVIQRKIFKYLNFFFARYAFLHNFLN